MQHIEHVMGTAVSIDIADLLPRRDLAGLVERTCAWLHEVDRRFSTYRADSEVSLFDDGDGGEPAGGSPAKSPSGGRSPSKKG